MDAPEPHVIEESGHGARPSPALAFLRLVFVGPHEIRAGWRLLVFLMIAAILGVGLSGIIRGLHLVAWPVGFIAGEGSGVLAVLLAALIVGRFEKRSLGVYLLPLGGAFGRRFWQGAVWGFVALSALLVAIHLDRGFDFGGLALHGKNLVSYAVLWAIAFLLVGLFEEFLVRGYALYTLTTGMGFWPAALLLSLLFGALHLHNAGESWVGCLAAAFIGLFFCFTVRRTGDLWFAIGLHGTWDYAESFVYSVPDSGTMVAGHLLNSSFHGPRWLTGGAVGPEGSVLVFVVIGAFFVIFDRVYRDVRFPAPANLTQLPTGAQPPSIGEDLRSPDDPSTRQADSDAAGLKAGS